MNIADMKAKAIAMGLGKGGKKGKLAPKKANDGDCDGDSCAENNPLPKSGKC